MSVIMDAASATRSTSGPQQFQQFGECLQFADTDGHTRVLAERVSDGALYAIWARGAVEDIIAAHNERLRLAHSLKSARDTRDADAALAEDAERMSAEDVDALAAVIADLEDALKACPGTKSAVTVHITRTVRHYDADPEDGESLAALTDALTDGEDGEDGEDA